MSNKIKILTDYILTNSITARFCVRLLHEDKQQRQNNIVPKGKKSWNLKWKTFGWKLRSVIDFSLLHFTLKKKNLCQPLGGESPNKSKYKSSSH